MKALTTAFLSATLFTRAASAAELPDAGAIETAYSAAKTATSTALKKKDKAEVAYTAARATYDDAVHKHQEERTSFTKAEKDRANLELYSAQKKYLKELEAACEAAKVSEGLAMQRVGPTEEAEQKVRSEILEAIHQSTTLNQTFFDIAHSAAESAKQDLGLLLTSKTSAAK